MDAGLANRTGLRTVPETAACAFHGGRPQGGAWHGLAGARAGIRRPLPPPARAGGRRGSDDGRLRLARSPVPRAARRGGHPGPSPSQAAAVAAMPPVAAGEGARKHSLWIESAASALRGLWERDPPAPRGGPHDRRRAALPARCRRVRGAGRRKVPISSLNCLYAPQRKGGNSYDVPVISKRAGWHVACAR